MNMLVSTKEEPRWMQELRKHCNQKSQRKVAYELDYSPTVISQVLKGIYQGNIKKFEQTVRGAYLGETVNCPVLGELEKNRCIEYQNQKMNNVNPLRVLLFKACNGGCSNCHKTELNT